MRWGSCAGEGWVGGPWGGTLGVTQALGECAVGGWVLPARQTMRACFQDEAAVGWQRVAGCLVGGASIRHSVTFFPSMHFCSQLNWLTDG